MKSLILVIALLSIVGCGMSLNTGLSPKMKEDNLRSRLSHMWQTCRQLKTGSALYVLDFTAAEMTIDAQVYKSSDCTGSSDGKYYYLARYDYSNFATIGETQGTADVQQITYYSYKIEAEDGVVRIGSRPLLRAKASFVVSSDAKQLVLNLSNLILDDSPEFLRVKAPAEISDSSTISFNLQRYVYNGN